MTDRADLERRYRRLLASYPRAFRQDSGEELIAVLMASASEGQRRPGVAGTADLIRSGLRMRLRPSVPGSARTVRAAVRLMYAGAAVTTVSLIAAVVSVAVVGRGAASLRVLGRSQPALVAIPVGIAIGLVLIALWLWMAWANGQGRNWARILSTAVVGLATLQGFGAHGIVELIFAVLTWLIGAAAVWLLWRPASNAFFNSHGPTQTGHTA
jgi:hypothetical protein